MATGLQQARRAADDIRRLTNVVEAQLKGKGMIFNYPDNKSFRDALSMRRSASTSFRSEMSE